MIRNLKGTVFLMALVGAGLSGCQSEIRLEPDFGAAIGQDKAAQIADPDAHYAGIPDPGSNGNRVALTQQRYEVDKVVPPSTLAASSNGTTSGFDNGNAPSAPGAGATAGSTGP